ncbi:FIST C-terminal domain-containing protein [Desulfovibrio sp. OttesenSCG-928-C14]|nr:FIST C-terminal domain-containing protein [Desulfovibrio sp. OttesenSCG-928-C14]
MHVGVGYSDNPDTVTAGRQAAHEAIAKSGKKGPCDLVLLFSTSSHDPLVLRGAVASVFGPGAAIVGGGATGAICNDRYGYAGDQIILAAIWFEGARYSLLAESGLNEGEEEAGLRLGKRLAALDTRPESPALLFYDAVDRSRGDMRLLMATPLLAGLKKGLGFLPDLVGAGLQGDYIGTPTLQWTGQGLAGHSALALVFDGNIRMDSVIMHGCKPATGYYKVTKSDNQTILEINGEPALPFLDRLLGASIPRSSYPLFLIFGINKGDKWGEFDENNYINHLCLALDEERNGIVMFEPDMVEGTEFQIMFRSLDLDYMAPRIEGLFQDLGGRLPVFALYIDCAGRAAGYGGVDLEDAVVVQKTVAGRVPLLGLYTGVEIAKVGGVPRGLDWTGVFCLFSVGK